MTKVESTSGEVSEWADLNKDILELIFNKLDVMDITMGASRVCISWFLASHNKTLWNTVDLTNLQELDVSRIFNFKDKERPIFFYKHPVDHKHGLTNLLTKIISRFFLDFFEVEGSISLMNLLVEISKLSRMAPKNLFFNFNSYIQENGLKFAAEKMPNIEKLALPIWCYQNEKSLRFAFSQWKNLKTLIIAHEHSFSGRFDFKAVGESCSNLTNLKYLGRLEEYTSREIVSYLHSLKRLSLRCFLVSSIAVYRFITGLPNLTILNVSHCKNPYDYFLPIAKSIDNYVITAATQKLEKFITCPHDCMICKDRCRYSLSYLAEVHAAQLGDLNLRLSRMNPKNLFFHFNSYVQTEDLMFAAERMPNIEKLVLPVWCYKTEDSFQFAFSQWKNLKTLIIAQDYQLRKLRSLKN